MTYYQDEEITKEIIASAIEVHKAQVITYLRVLNKQVGLLINFNVPILKQGIRRIVLKAEENHEEILWAKPS